MKSLSAKLAMWLVFGFLGTILPAHSSAQSKEEASPELRASAEALAAGDLAHAEIELQAILKTNPKEYRAMNLLGILRAQQHRTTEAEQLFEEVIAQQPSMVSPHVNLGILYAQTSREAEAIGQLQKALQIEPGRQDAVLALTNLLRAQARATAAQDPEKALSLLLQARGVAPQDPDVLYDFGMVSLRMALYTDAAEAFRGTLAARRDAPAALYGLGRAQIGLTKYQEARATFQSYLALRPNDASGHYAMGLALAAQQKSEEARGEFAASIRLQPVQTESYYQLALLQIEQKQFDEATDNLQHVLARDSHHAGALAGMGRVEFGKKEYAKAADYLRQSIEVFNNQREAHYYLGLTYARLGQNEESAKELEIAGRIEHEEAEKLRMGVHILNSDHP